MVDEELDEAINNYIEQHKGPITALWDMDPNKSSLWGEEKLPRPKEYYDGVKGKIATVTIKEHIYLDYIQLGVVEKYVYSEYKPDHVKIIYKYM